MAVRTRLRRSFKTSLSNFISTLGYSSPVVSWRAEGKGRDLLVYGRLQDQTIPNQPQPGVDLIRQREEFTNGQQIYQAFFNSLPVRFFENVTVRFSPDATPTDIFFDLNLEEE